MIMHPLALFALIGGLVSASSPVSYDGYQVLRVTTGANSAAVLEKLSSIEYDEWNTVVNKHIDIAIAPNQIERFQTLALEYHVMHENLAVSIASESATGTTWKRQIDDLEWYDSYHPYDDHKAYFEALHNAFPNNSEIVSSGTSFEGRDIFGIHFWGSDGPGKPAVLWHGTVHAREWIVAPVMEYLTLQLIQGYGVDNTTTAFVDTYDFWVFPFVNPDGFVYTQTTERLWRKNRQPAPTSTNSTCYGRDINRNWPYKWDANPLGTSTDPCSQTYKGIEAGDTPEMEGLHKLVDTLRDASGLKLYIDWHSYSQYFLTPVGYNCTYYIDTLGQHIKLAQLASDAIREVEGVTFTYGPSCATLYPTTGASFDYAYAVGKTQWSYLIELRDTGDFGFVLPPEQIRGSVKEQWEGMKVMLSVLGEVFFDGEGPAAF
ncbi:Metallocarboxypeptidase A-like protein [Colletotrichum fructicola]|uniref:Metallocarboxypeptidase A-like protein n=2 Tax=Colletotrichum fructicola (strain Nara gc5) TaxID=1213859 RepID=A0A7J6IIN3_COLFN|nr:Metallocarboxypeptidase A-like protein [Colletotrichum fructicola]KAE9570540.1 Metallocarboxypeptidase A-like protein [Colletotrichum fructicola]KAF4427787.1 Metallocarboxypeptidase A-like protein [Colletotrichum fructicola]KAF4476508.1 Metallocarboxypeptidase A-like protein [Colletotrichum fructicola Nara gc5]